VAPSPAPGPDQAAERALVAVVADWPVVAARIAGDVGEGGTVGAGDTAHVGEAPDGAGPVVVVHANRVVAASGAARAAGVTVGLRRREAQGRCPAAAVVTADPAREGRTFEPLAAALDAVTPRVEVRHPGEVAFPTRGPSRYFGGDAALVHRVAGVLDARLPPGVAPGVAVADGTFAAGCAARSGPAVVEPGASAAFLADRPVGEAAEHLDRDDAREATSVLARLGVRALGALAALPAPDVLARFGPAGELLHRLARGLDPRPLATRRAAPELAVAVELDPPIDRTDVLAFRAVALADDLHARLARDGRVCLRLGVEVETDHGERRRRSWRHEGGLTASAVAERVRWQLDGWLDGPAAERPTAGVTVLRLDPEEVTAARGRQLGFWGGETRIDEEAARALARVAALLGPDAVTVAEVTGGRGPTDRIASVPAAAVDLGARTVVRPGPTGPWPGRLPPPSPALVPASPVEVELRAADGTAVAVDGRGTVSAPPARLGRVEVVAWAGPWPADERWWDPDRARRRARVQVVLADGTAHLLALEGGVWHREGSYD